MFLHITLARCMRLSGAVGHTESYCFLSASRHGFQASSRTDILPEKPLPIIPRHTVPSLATKGQTARQKAPSTPEGQPEGRCGCLRPEYWSPLADLESTSGVTEEVVFQTALFLLTFCSSDPLRRLFQQSDSCTLRPSFIHLLMLRSLKGHGSGVHTSPE